MLLRLSTTVAPPPIVPAPPVVDPQPEPPASMDESRERVIQMGEEHCRRYQHDSICHPPR